MNIDMDMRTDIDVDRHRHDTDTDVDIDVTNVQTYVTVRDAMCRSAMLKKPNIIVSSQK